MQQSDARTNRIPTESELKGLRDLREMHYRRICQLEEDANIARAKHEALTACLQRQLQELEGTRSQLSFSEKALKIMEDQRKVLEEACGDISSRLHPIKRCPQDILQMILVETVKESEEPVEEAFRLSQVCRRWREVARTTPRLWARAVLDLKIKPPLTVNFWGSIVDLMGNVDADISLHNIDADAGRIFKKLSKKMPPFIDTLFLTTSNVTFLNKIGQNWSRSDLKAIQHLWVHQTDIETEQDVSEDVVWTLLSIVEPLPTLSCLYLQAPCKLDLSPCPRLDSISTLRLEDINNFEVDLLSDRFTNLSSLDLREITFAPGQPSKPFMLTSLRDLTVANLEQDGTPFFQAILCLHLETLRLYDDIKEADFNALLDRHPSIRNLAYSIQWAVFPAGIASLHRLLSLETPPSIAYLYEWEPTVGTMPPLMFLENLIINTRNHELNVKDFEAIVKSRCLPDDHRGCSHLNGTALIRQLSIERDEVPNPEIAEPWRESPLYKEAKKRVVPITDFSGNASILSWTGDIL